MRAVAAGEHVPDVARPDEPGTAGDEQMSERPIVAHSLGHRAGDGGLEPAGGMVLGRDLGGAQQGRHGSGVGPVTLVDPAEQGAQRDVVVEHVGDLELAAARRQEAVDDLEGVRPEEVDADRDEVALRMLRASLRNR